MTIIVKNDAPLTIPDEVRRQAGLKPGDKVEFRAFRGGVTVLTKTFTARVAEHPTPQEARKLRHALKQVRAAKTKPWSRVKHDLDM